MMNHEQQVAHRAFAVLSSLKDNEREVFVGALEPLGLRIADFYFGFTRAIASLHRDASKKGEKASGAIRLLEELYIWLVLDGDDTAEDLSNKNADYFAERLIQAAGNGQPTDHDKFWTLSARALQFIEHLKNFS
jgi:hypothetical protein